MNVSKTLEQVRDRLRNFGKSDWADPNRFTCAVLAGAIDAHIAASNAPGMTDTMRAFIEGMSVSVDVSTGDHDAEHRYFGTVTEVMDDHSDKHGVTLLVQDATPNFSNPTSKAQPVGAVMSREVQVAADGWTLAEKVRTDLDKQSCPDAFMRIAVESIVRHCATMGHKAAMSAESPRGKKG